MSSTPAEDGSAVVNGELVGVVGTPLHAKIHPLLQRIGEVADTVRAVLYRGISPS